MLEALEVSNTYCMYTYGLNAKGAKAVVKNREHLTIFPIFMAYSLFCSFFFIQIFPYSIAIIEGRRVVLKG